MLSSLWSRARWRRRLRSPLTTGLLAAIVCAPAVTRAEAGPAGQPSSAKEAIHRALQGRCRTKSGLGILTSPRRPIRGQALRVVVVSPRPREGAQLVARQGKERLALDVLHRGGPPYFWFAEVDKARRGKYRFALVSKDGRSLACRRAWVSTNKPSPPEVSGSYWPVKRSWNRITESFYSAWIEKLFDAPANAQPSWSPLHEVIRDPERNFLYNHLGTDEDGPRRREAVVVKPDCADLPYYLRAYFAWKLRLPFGYRHCDRGTSRRAARRGELRSNLSIDPGRRANASPAKRFSWFLRRYVSYVHSGAGRTAPGDNDTDLYPVALNRESLRPGTVYVDPHGHLLIVAKWINQRPGRGGLLYAVDGHPDLSVGRKRFWRGAFMFSDDIKKGAGGFKAFRPLRVEDGEVVALTNEEIRKSRVYRNYSVEQYRLGLDGFYDRMDRIINPKPLTPVHAYSERLDALYELILERVDSVKAGEEYMEQVSYKTMDMPRGPRIFETRGPWENYSTPARDMRLLIAIHEVVTFPKKVATKPDHFHLPDGQSPAEARAQMRELFREVTAKKKFSYTRSDGTAWTLSMADLIARQEQLEMGYNPNDCIEIRWGASGKERATCKRHAPPEQRQRMKRYREWFATRTRPPLR
jgi:hypothetical protein